MSDYNCVHIIVSHIIGPLVYRAQGYKRLRNELIMSTKYFMPERSLKNFCDYCIVSENVVAKNLRIETEQTLKMGTLVKVKNFRKGPNVMVIDLENQTNSSEETVFLCQSKALVYIDEQILNLIIAVSSPIEKIRIAKDRNLCRELCSINIGSFVRIQPLSVVGIVTRKCEMPKLGPGIYFEVEPLCTENYAISCHLSNQVYTVDQLRLDKLEKLNESNPKEFSTFLKNELRYISDGMYCERAETKKISEKLDYDSKQHKSKTLRPGDEVIWFSEIGEQQGTICVCFPVNVTARVHLGDSRCKGPHCDRLKTQPLQVTDLILKEEYYKSKHAESQMKNKRCSSILNEVNIDDLLNIDQTDSCVTHTSYNNVLKECADDKKLLKNERNNSLNEFEEATQFTTNESTNSDELGIGSVVEVSVNDEPQYGVIKWIGRIQYGNLTVKHLLAGIEMEESKSFNDGCLNGNKYFDCAPQRGHFVMLSTCKKDSRFQDSPYVCDNELKTPDDFGLAVIPGIVEPINQADNLHTLCGKYKGIQGHNNSCYLDATLFSMFTFTSVFDSLLYRPSNENDIESYEKVQRVLREEIVNPLRKNLFVRADRVMNLRTLLNDLTSVTGLTCEEKDPEEFLTSLVAQVLKAEPFLKLSSGHEAYYYQLFVEKDERLRLPNVQQLFEQSLITSDIKLKEVPSCLIIQMPRFGKSYKMYPRILPSQILDVTNVIENSPKECTVCGVLAEFECKDCLKHFSERQFCSSCVKTVHSHEDRVNHKYTALQIPQEFKKHRSERAIPRQCMELFAVLCIETSHYVAFVKCGQEPDTPWCFFDSMADRKGGLNGFNIPEMVFCPDLPLWLSEDGGSVFLRN